MSTFRWQVNMKIEGPVLDTRTNEEYWVWRIHLVGTNNAEFGTHWTQKDCHESLNYWCSLWTGRNLVAQCECGSQNLYPVFSPGHAHWCPVTPLNVVPPPRRPGSP